MVTIGNGIGPVGRVRRGERREVVLGRGEQHARLAEAQRSTRRAETTWRIDKVCFQTFLCLFGQFHIQNLAVLC